MSKKKVTKKRSKKKIAKKKAIAKREIAPAPEKPEQTLAKRFLFSQTEIAELFGVTTRSVQNWDIKPKAKQSRRVMYYLPEVIAFRMRAAEAGPSTTYELTEERSRLTHHQANIESLKEQQFRDELFSVEEVLMLCAGSQGAARNRVLGIHSKVASQHPELDTEIIETIEELSIEALNEIGTDGIPPSLRERIRPVISRMESATEKDS